MLDCVVVDVEIAHTIEETEGGWNATDKLGVAVACIWEYRTQRMRVYGPGDVPALRDRLLQADRISGYNHWGFDYPVIWGVNKKLWNTTLTTEALSETYQSVISLKERLLPKTNDLLRRIRAALGVNQDTGSWTKGTSLDVLGPATLGADRVKVGDGADAPVWYQAGNVQKVANYCADDVAIERDLTDFVDRYGYVIHQGTQLFLKK